MQHSPLSAYFLLMADATATSPPAYFFCDAAGQLFSREGEVVRPFDVSPLLPPLSTLRGYMPNAAEGVMLAIVRTSTGVQTAIRVGPMPPLVNT